jgi:hypothetical protein
MWSGASEGQKSEPGQVFQLASVTLLPFVWPICSRNASSSSSRCFVCEGRNFQRALYKVLKEYAFTAFEKGRLACPVPNQCHIFIARSCWFGKDLFQASIIWLAQSRAHLWCLQRVENVDYLLIAKLVAISSLGNPPWSGKTTPLGRWLHRLQVVLIEGHDFCFVMKQEEMCLNNVRSGNKAVSICSWETLVAAMRTSALTRVGNVWIRDELQPEKGQPLARRVFGGTIHCELGK